MPEQTRDSITFKESDVKPVMKVEELVELSNKYNRNLDLKFYTNNFGNVDYLINKAFETNNNLDPEFTKKEILDTTYFSTYENWNLTNLARKYRLSSFDFFYALGNSQPFGVGALAHDSNKMKKDEMRKEFTKMSEDKDSEYKDYVFIDYWNGIGFKSRFPINVDNNATPFELNIRRYNDRNGYMGFDKIFNLIDSNKERINNDYLKYVPTIKESYGETIVDTQYPTIASLFAGETKESMSLLENKNKKINEYVEKNSNVTLEQLNKKGRYLSHRTECEMASSYKDEKIWDYQITPFYERYIKPELCCCDITSTFEFNTYGLIRPSLHYNNKIPIDKMSMVNMLMFGKTKVNFDFLERLFTFVRFKESNYTFQLDNFVIDKSKYQFGNTARRYDVLWNDENIHELKFPVNDYEKLYVAKNIIQLMNEVNPEHLNYHNYLQICEWERTHNLSIQQAHISTRNEIERIQSKYNMYVSLSTESNKQLK
jgi:hypothetical protein